MIFLGATISCARSSYPVDTAKSDLPTQDNSTIGAKPYLNMPMTDKGIIPHLLSETGAFTDTSTLTPAPGLLSYSINVPFWSGDANKLRWMALPLSGTGVARIGFSPTGAWRFPHGTVFVKHFMSSVADQRRLETRLLVCDETGGVYGVSYKWRPDQEDAERVDRGQRVPVRSGQELFNHFYPGPEDCRKCHLAAAGGVLGVNTRQLNGAETNPLLAWSGQDLLEPPVHAADLVQLPKLPRLERASNPVEDRARAFLDVNCAYCHRPGGAAADFDARWETPLTHQALINAPARINFGIDQARQIAPKDPWRSMALLRLATLEEIKMPPLGHEQIDSQGVALLREWIATLPGPPVVAPPTISPKGDDFKQPIEVTISHADRTAEIRYTLNGIAPGPGSTLYAGPLLLTESATVRARAYIAGNTHSIVVQETFIIDH
jgi:hypothetical protein